ncbi:MAG: peptidase M42, partial [Dehalococcoidia bacterium]|nr:peptidase M42 [Dehalococcoidia bacterium]
QEAVLSAFGSDAGLARKAGAVPRSACVGFPAENSHGYEVAHLGGMLNCGRLLEAVARDWPL